jgi:hypothetical protein
MANLTDQSMVLKPKNFEWCRGRGDTPPVVWAIIPKTIRTPNAAGDSRLLTTAMWRHDPQVGHRLAPGRALTVQR